MAKRFHFDDEDDIQDEYQPSSYLDDLENKRENVPYTAIDEEDDEEEEPMKKKKMVALSAHFIWSFSCCFYYLYRSFII